MDYKEQIKSPKWQKKRLEVMQKDNFTCQLCGNTESMLNVHHLSYHRDRNIWEYEEWELITLCENCHKEEHSSMDDIINEIDSIKSRGVTMREIIAVLDSIDVHLYLGHDDCIYNLVGEDSAMGRESDIKLLYERRKMLKKLILIISSKKEKIKKKILFKLWQDP